MAHNAKVIAEGSSHLSRVLWSLNAQPKLTLTNIRSLKLTLASRNDHFGARHFLKEELPRIRYANPTIDIHVEKVFKTKEEKWKPEMELEFTNGEQKTLSMHEKWSSAILKDLMNLAGGDPWQVYKAKQQAEGLPLIPGEEKESSVSKRSPQLPSLKNFRAAAERRASQKVTQILEVATNKEEGCRTRSNKPRADSN